jgi:hypothetical protein
MDIYEERPSSAPAGGSKPEPNLIDRLEKNQNLVFLFATNPKMVLIKSNNPMVQLEKSQYRRHEFILQPCFLWRLCSMAAEQM